MTQTKLKGAWLIEPQPVHDHRGFFARTFCVRELGELGLETQFVQHSTSHSVQCGTLRGMHFQRPPFSEVKVVTCSKGAIYDVIVDLRPDSPTYCQWQGFELTAANRRRLYIPKGFAHGFQSLEPDSEVSYLISEFYVPEAASGVRHDDRRFGIAWPLPPVALSPKDATWPNFAG